MPIGLECPGLLFEELLGDGRKELIELTELMDSDGVEVLFEDDIEDGIDCSLLRIVLDVEFFLRT